VKCSEPTGRTMLWWMVGGRRALKAVTFVWKDRDRRGRQIKCVFRAGGVFMMYCESKLERRATGSIKYVTGGTRQSLLNLPAKMSHVFNFSRMDRSRSGKRVCVVAVSQKIVTR